jgi:hypothetical protein
VLGAASSPGECWSAQATGGLADTRRAAGENCFTAHGLVAAFAFLLPVYIATNFGSIDQYLAMFAAGFLGKVALDQAAPVRSVRLAPSTKPPARTGGGDAEDGGGEDDAQ